MRLARDSEPILSVSSEKHVKRVSERGNAMHEMGVVLQTIRTACSAAESSGAISVRKLTLDIGQASSIMPKYFEKFFYIVIPDYPLLKDCELVIEETPAKAFCLDCGEVFDPIRHETKIMFDAEGNKIYPTERETCDCPSCGSKRFRLLEGNSMIIKNLEIE